MGAEMIRTEEVEVHEELVRSLVSLGGYTHPLFAGGDDPSRTPLPGQGVLLLLGGMVERSGCLDHARALIGLDRVEFRRMVRAGDRIHGELRLLDAEPTRSGASIESWSWRVCAGSEEVLVARARMLVDGRAAEEGPDKKV